MLCLRSWSFQHSRRCSQSILQLQQPKQLRLPLLVSPLTSRSTSLTTNIIRYVAESGVALWVGNLPLCWPVLRLALGSKGDSSNPSYPNPSYPENSTRRRTQGRSKPSVWAKLEDERVPEQGSQIELVDQNPYYVEAKASGDAHEERGNGHITVVTKVEVSEGRL